MPKKILVVDDSRTIRQQVQAALVPAGFEVLEASDGLQGIRQIEALRDLAMVICDVNMPSMNGIEMVTALRDKGRMATLPVLMLTTEGGVDLINKAKQAGAKGWLVKPFKPEQLVRITMRLAGG